VQRFARAVVQGDGRAVRLTKDPLHGLLRSPLARSARGSCTGLLDGHAHPVERDRDATRLGGHRVRLDQRLLGVGGVPLVEVAHRVGHALEAGACEGQAAQGFAGGVGLSGGALLEQEGHGAARPRQPPLADDAGPQAHGIDGPGAAVSRLSVDGALDDDLARAGVVGGRVSPDARVHDAVDEDGGRVEVEGAEQNLMGPATSTATDPLRRARPRPRRLQQRRQRPT
jgi:hypothetical protein